MRRAVGPARAARLLPAIASLVMLAGGLAATSVPAATSSTSVEATVPSATTIDVSGCAAGVPGRTHFGNVTVGSLNVTSLDCAVKFGSSNDTAMLQIAQDDSAGTAMWRSMTGAFDASFGTNGSVVTPGGGRAIAVQTDGKVVVAGLRNNGTDTDFLVSRFTASGALDPAFGTGGTVITDIVSNDAASAVAIQPDGKIIAAGYSNYTGGPGDNSTIVRYTSSGALDTTFNGTGIFYHDHGSQDVITGIAIQPDGKILTGGTSAGYWRYTVQRVTATGSLDPTFNSVGYNYTSICGGGFDQASAVALQPDGKFLVVGHCVSSGYGVLARYEANGVLDPTFGTGGKTTLSMSTNPTVLNAVVLMPDGRFIVAGADGSKDFLVARYSSTGTLDPTFGTAGITTTDFGGGVDIARSIQVMPDGKLLLLGSGGPGNDFAMARYSAEGVPDTSFGTGGRVMIDFGAGDAIAGAARVIDGKIVAVGSSAGNLVTMQFGTVPVSDYVTGGGSDRDWASGASTSMFAVCLHGVSGGATNQWAQDPSCAAVDGPAWNDVPTIPEKVAYTTALEPDPPDATALFLFGFRPASDQLSGDYIAPVVFNVVAPNV